MTNIDRKYITLALEKLQEARDTIHSLETNDVSSRIILDCEFLQLQESIREYARNQFGL